MHCIRFILAMCLLFTLTGCPESDKTRVAMGKIPVLQKINRPMTVKVTVDDLAPLTPEARKKVTDNNDAIMLYAHELEDELRIYDLFQQRWNSMADTWLNANVQTTKAK